jgi:hypothetical protein
MGTCREIKPPFKLGNPGNSIFSGILAEDSGKSSTDNNTRVPFVKKGYMHFKRRVKFFV